MSEIEQYIESKSTLASATKATYLSNYKKLQDILEKENVQKIPQREIINKIHETIQNPNSKLMLINIAINIKGFKDEETKMLINNRELIKIEINQQKNIKKLEKKDTLPTYNDLNLYLKKLFLDKEWRAYIINYLLINYNVRNKDLDVAIVENLKQTNDDDNFLVVNTRNRYIRNRYKTYSKYGSKVILFQNKSFQTAVEQFLESVQHDIGEKVYLLSDSSGNRINENSLGNYIQKYTMNDLTESDYNKVSVSRIKDMSDYPLLKKISDSRGTAIDTLVSEYNLNIQLE